MWWLVVAALGWSRITSVVLPDVTSVTQTERGVCLFAYNDTNVYSYYSLDHGVIDPSPFDFSGCTDMAIAKSGNATVWMDVEEGVSVFYVYDLQYTQRIRFIPRTSPNSIMATGVKVAMDQTGNVVVMTDDENNVYVQEWHDGVWRNISTSFTINDVDAFGRLLRVVTYTDTVVVGTTYVEGTDSYVAVCINETEWNCSLVYTSTTNLVMDMTNLGDNFIMAIGLYQTTEGGVVDAGSVHVKGAYETVLTGTDVTLYFGSAVCITPTQLVVSSLGPAQDVIVYQLVGSQYHRFQTVPINDTVLYVTISGEVLIVITEGNASFFEPTSSSPTSAPTWYPTVASSVSSESIVVSIYGLCAVIVLLVAFFAMKYSFSRNRYHQMRS